MQPEDRAVAGQHAPAPGRRPPQWTAGGWPAVRTSKAPVAEVQGEVHGGGEALVPVLAAAGSRWRRGGTRPAAARRAGRRRPRTSSSARVPASSPLPDTSTTTTSRPRRRGTGWPRRSRPRTPCRPPSASADSTCQPRGQARDARPWLRIRSRRSTSIDSPARPADAEPGTPREAGQHDQADQHLDHRPRRTMRAVRLRLAGSAPRQEQHQDDRRRTSGSLRGPSKRLPSSSGTVRLVKGIAGRAAATATSDHESRARRAAPGTDVRVRASARTMRGAGCRAVAWRRPSARARPTGGAVTVRPVAWPGPLDRLSLRPRDAERRLASRTPEEVASRAAPRSAPVVRRRGRARRHGGRRRTCPRGRRAAAARPIASGVCSGRTVSIRPVRTPSAISATRSSHIARHWPTRRRAARRGAGRCGAGRAPRRGRRCPRRPAPLVHQQRRRSARGCAGSAPRPGPGRRPGAAGRVRAGRRTAVALARGVTSSHAVAPRRSAYVAVAPASSASPTSRSRTCPTGSGTADAVADTSNRAVEPEVHVHQASCPRSSGTGACPTTRPAPPAPSSSAADSANRPCGLLDPHRAAGERVVERRWRAGGGCGPQASGARSCAGPCADAGSGGQLAGALVASRAARSGARVAPRR